MIADFAQFYGLFLRPNEEPGDLLTYSVLWEQLPRESRCVRKQNPDAEWTDAEYLLHSIEHSLRVLIWQKTKDGQKKRNEPKFVQTPGERARNQKHADNAIANRNEIDRILGIGGDHDGR